jgi:GT2 family glycosyltransferase
MGHYVLILGAHTTICTNYIQTLVKDLQDDPTAACAGGVSVSVSDNTLFQEIAGCVRESRFGVGSSYFKIGAQTKKYVDTVAYGLYRKEALDRVGLFDERLIRNQDIELSHRVRQHGYNIILNPDVSAYYYPRSSLSGFCKQGFSNGYWNITTHRLVPGSLSMRHFVPLLAVMCGIGLFVLSFYSFWAKVVLSLLVASYLALAMYESVSIALKKRNPRALLSLFVFPLLHVSYGLGSLCSLVSLSTRRSR